MTTVASVRWRRIDAPGRDFCQLEHDRFGWRLDGEAIFLQDSQPARLSYSLRCNRQWEAVSGLLRGTLGPKTINYVFTREQEGWMLNGYSVPGLQHLVDLDFSFTPATNLAQLRRVSLPLDRAVQVPVAWFDWGSGMLAEMPQTYLRRGEREIWYEAPTVGYRGLLELDANGFVCRYPALWEEEAPSNSGAEEAT